MSDFLRPSLLPKLALCGSYRSEPMAGDAAARGTRMDVAFREAISATAGDTSFWDGEDAQNVLWAIDTARALAGANALEAREEHLRIEACGMTGTADLLCSEGSWSADLKSGQIRNYAEQQAAYALGFMDAHFADEWTIYLIYCDQREVTTLRFTRDEAEALIRKTIAKAHSDEPPQLNDYCGWCANRFACAPRREALGILTDEPELEQLSSDILRNFVLRAGTVDDFATKARDIIKQRIIGGEKIAGCSVVSKRGSRKMPERVIELNLSRLGIGDVLAAYGPMPEAKLLEIWGRKLPDTEFPADQAIESPGSAYIRVSQPKLK